MDMFPTWTRWLVFWRCRSKMAEVAGKEEEQAMSCPYTSILATMPETSLQYHQMISQKARHDEVSWVVLTRSVFKMAYAAAFGISTVVARRPPAPVHLSYRNRFDARPKRKASDLEHLEMVTA